MPAFHVLGANTLKKADSNCPPLPVGRRQPQFPSLAPLLPPQGQLSGSKLSIFSAVAKSEASLAHVLFSIPLLQAAAAPGPLTCLGDLHSYGHLLEKLVSLLKQCVLSQVPVLNARSSGLILFLLK